MKIFILIFLAFVSVESTQFRGNKVIQVVPKSEEEVGQLSKLQKGKDIKIDFWSWPSNVGRPVDMHVTTDEYKRLARYLNEHGLTFTIQIPDVQRLVDREKEQMSRMKRSEDNWYSNYHTLDEINDELGNLAHEYNSTDKVMVYSIGKSYQNRDQNVIMIKGRRTSNPNYFFMNCGIHAREWITHATCMYIAKQLLSRYGKDDDVTAILDKMYFIILPVANPDGYVQTWKQDRTWRKTMKPNSCNTTFGTDPNRNWDFKWNEPGSDTNPCSPAYRGSHPFSENEVKNIAHYLRSLGSRVKGYMDIHAFGQIWLLPWGYTKSSTEDHDELMRVANLGATAIRNAGYNTEYIVGPSSWVLYKNFGASVDYTYGVLGIKYSFALELRDKGAKGFLLPASQIIPTAMETFEGIKAMAKAMKI